MIITKKKLQRCKTVNMSIRDIRKWILSIKERVRMQKLLKYSQGTRGIPNLLKKLKAYIFRPVHNKFILSSSG